MAALRRSCLVLAVALLVASCAGSMAGKKHRRHHHHGQKKAAAAPSSTAAAKVAAAGNMRFTEVGAQLVNTRQAVSRAYVDAAAAANQPIVAQEVQQVQQKPALPAAAAQPVSMRQQQQQQQQQQGVSADSLLRFQQTGSRGGLFGKTAGLEAKGGSTSSGSKSGSPSSSGAKSGMMASMGMGSTTPAMGAPADWPVPSASDKKGGAQFVPFGKHIPRQTEMQYFVSTSIQECMVCRRIIDHSYSHGRNYPILCESETEEYLPMCTAQAKVLQACPEFVNNWCYQDLGGTQVLKSPCPDAFICHYCLGMNPLHCLDSVENAREAKKLDV